MHRLLFILLFLPALLFSQQPETKPPPFQIESPSIIIRNIQVHYGFEVSESYPEDNFLDTTLQVRVNNEIMDVEIFNRKGSIPVTFDKSENLEICWDGHCFTSHATPIPLWMSVLPPLIAILFALLFREVFSALFIGLLTGTTIISWYQGHVLFVAVFKGIFLLIDTYIIESLNNTDHLSIIVFSMLIGAMVNVITRNGGMKGVVNILARHAKNSRSGQFITWLMGILIFFDDYANTLVVGNTMRPMTDRLRISREKLAYLVDSTAAPIASIAFVTTWIGAELSYIQDGINTLGLNQTAYSVFFSSLQYSFYPVLALMFILILVFTGSDFGPMRKAEMRAREGKGEVITTDGGNSFSNELNETEIRPHWYNAVIPVLIIILGTLAGLLYTGWDAAIWQDPSLAFTKKLSMTIGQSNAYKSLLWSSLGGVLTALLLTLSQRLLSLKDSLDSLINGFRTMLTAIVILIMAWSIALVTQHMHTASFISEVMLRIALSPYLVPAITFVLAALIAFSTGSSWGTMAILYPLILPSSWLIAQDSGLDHGTSLSIFYNVVSCVLAGSVLGDHCSPISDTTILSSLASSCNHIEHVRTQLPYALTVGIVAIAAGTIPSAYGVSSYILFPVSLVILILLVRVFGRKVSLFTLDKPSANNQE